jgi:hypothetical protein
MERFDTVGPFDECPLFVFGDGMARNREFATIGMDRRQSRPKLEQQCEDKAHEAASYATNTDCDVGCIQ